MTDAPLAQPPPIRVGTLIGRSLRLMWWAWSLPAALVASLVVGNFTALLYVHVIAGVLWTGADLFLGFVVGPMMRRLQPPVRKEVMGALISRTIVYMFVMSSTTITGGYYLAERLGFSQPSSGVYGLYVAAGVIGAVLTVQGLGFILPTELRAYLEVESPEPDMARVQRLMTRFVRLVASQAILQVAVIFVMTLFIG